MNTTSGISANGMPKDRNTWLSTSARVGLKPTASRTRAGSMVMARRRKTGIRRCRKPSITTWPDIVPTQEDAMPETSSATPNTVPACVADVVVEPGDHRAEVLARASCRRG